MIFRRVLGPGELVVALRRADAADLFAAVDRNREHLRAWLPWVDQTAQVEDSLAFLDECERQTAANGMLTCALRQQGRLVGVIGYHRIDWGNRATKLGYWLDASVVGQGLMTRAVVALLEHAWDHLGMHRIEIRAATGNLRSQAIPRRLGFWHEGTARDAEWLYDHWVDLEVFAMTEPVWRERHPGEH